MISDGCPCEFVNCSSGTAVVCSGVWHNGACSDGGCMATQCIDYTSGSAVLKQATKPHGYYTRYMAGLNKM